MYSPEIYTRKKIVRKLIIKRFPNKVEGHVSLKVKINVQNYVSNTVRLNVCCNVGDYVWDILKEKSNV